MVLNLYQVHTPTSNDYSALQNFFHSLTDKAHRAPPKTKKELLPLRESPCTRYRNHFSIPVSQHLYLTHPSGGPPLPRPVAFRVLPYLEAHLSLTSPTAANQLLLHYARSIIAIPQLSLPPINRIVASSLCDCLPIGHRNHLHFP